VKDNKPSYARLAPKFQKLPRTQKIIAGIGVAVLLVLVVLGIALLANRNRPEHSVTSFCGYLKANQVPQDWKADIEYYKQLEARAPRDVYQQTKTIRQTYEQMVKRPESAVGLDLSIAGTGNQFNDWVNTNCYPDNNADPGKSLQQWKHDFQKSFNED
jgi:hypothetical protein